MKSAVNDGVVGEGGIEALVGEYLTNRDLEFLECEADVGRAGAHEVCEMLKALRRRCRGRTLPLSTARRAMETIREAAIRLLHAMRDEPEGKARRPTEAEATLSTRRKGRTPVEANADTVRRYRKRARILGRRCAALIGVGGEDGEEAAEQVLADLVGDYPAIGRRRLYDLMRKRLLARRSPLRKLLEADGGRSSFGSRPLEDRADGRGGPGRRKRDDVTIEADAVTRRASSQIAVQARFERETGILLGRHDETAARRGREVHQVGGAWEWLCRPGCDDRVVQAVGPVAFRRSEAGRNESVAFSEIGLRVLGARIDEVTVGTSETADRLERLSQTIKDGRDERQAKRGGPAGGTRLPRWASRRAKRVALVRAADAIDRLAIDRAILKRLQWRYPKTVLDLLRWGNRLRGEAAEWAREATGRPRADGQFLMMVRRFANICGRRDRPLRPEMVGNAIYALDLDDGNLVEVLDAVADAFKVIRATEAYHVPGEIHHGRGGLTIRLPGRTEWRKRTK